MSQEEHIGDEVQAYVSPFRRALTPGDGQTKAYTKTFALLKVVVGKAFHHQTPVFSSVLRRVIFRRYWDVPLRIEVKELVPKLHDDRFYLGKNHFEVVNARNQVVSSTEADDRLLAQLSSSYASGRSRRSVPSLNAIVAVTGTVVREIPRTDAIPSSQISLARSRALTLEHMLWGQPTPASVTSRTVPSSIVRVAARDDLWPSRLLQTARRDTGISNTN